MINVTVKAVQIPPRAVNINKQIDFGTAVGLTKTAKQGQASVAPEVQKDFTYRNRWLPASNKFGIRITPATPASLKASIQTAAGWLAKQKIGGTVAAGQLRRTFPYTYEGREYIAIPSKDLRPRGSTKVLGKRLWPENLKNKLVIRTKNGTLLLAVRFGPRRTDVQIMYVLVPSVEVHARDAFNPPIDRTVQANLERNIAAEINKAFRTAK